MAIDYSELEEYLKKPLEGEHSSISLSFNEQALSYETVEEYLKHFPEQKEDFVSKEELDKAIKTNSMWTLHWFPRSPVVSIQLHASCLTKLLSIKLSE